MQTSADEDEEKQELAYIVSKNVKLCSHFTEKVQWFLMQLKIINTGPSTCTTKPIPQLKTGFLSFKKKMKYNYFNENIQDRKRCSDTGSRQVFEHDSSTIHNSYKVSIN